MLQNDDLRRRQLAELYDSYNDNALFDIVEEDLTDVARAVLREEIVRRGLGEIAEARLNEAENSVETERIVVWAGRTMEEAAIVMQMMHLANIEATLVPHRGTNPSERFQVNVATLDAEKALGVISTGVSETAAGEIVAEFLKAEVVIPACPFCSSNQVKFEDSREGNCWSCERCREQWEEDPSGLAESKIGDRMRPLPKSPEDTIEEMSEFLAKNRRRRFVNRLTVSLVLISSILAIVTAWPTSWTWMRIAGLAFWVVGAIIWTVARLRLGSNFTGKAEARELVITGIYARMQNPIYISGAIVTSGICLYFNKPWALLLVLITVPVQIRRVRRERAVLAEAFGDRYVQYRSRTWF
jgi:protein-S-isoprenylcysteine O-methyltransferase Ste14